MITFGGPKYRWCGHHVRNIAHQDRRCLSMPRIDSAVAIPIDINPMSMYSVVVTALNNNGNGSLNIEFSGEGHSVPPTHIYTRAKMFLEYKFDIMVDAVSDNMFLKLTRPRGSTGNILIDSITYEEVVRPQSSESIAADQHAAAVKEYKDKVAAAQEKTRAVRAKNTERLESERTNTLVSRGELSGTPVKVGGRGYRWRGKGIRTGANYGGTCVYLPTSSSMIIVPGSIVKESKYRVTVSASKVTASSSGAVMVNLFGGLKFDGPHQQIDVNKSGLHVYTIEIMAPAFPTNLPMNLRFWRPPGSKGSICIKDIEYVQISNVVPMQLKLQPVRKKPRPPRPAPPAPRPIRPIKENYDMKFRPYKTRTAREDVLKVLVTEASHVPKVSIITPTRNGYQLLKNCYQALRDNTGYPNWEWIVGDSESDDGTIEFMRGLSDPRVKFVERGTTEGSFSSINNELVAASDGEYILFLNNDTEPEPFWLYEMVSKIHRHDEIGVVGARLEYANGDIQHAGVAFIPQGPANLGKAALKSFGPGYANHDRFYQAVTAACMLMRRCDFDAVGGYDPVYHFCYEDIDLCLKVGAKLKKKVLYAANARVKHLESVTQRKHKTSGDLQKAGIDVFKGRWMRKVELDFGKCMSAPAKGIYPVDISFVTCINNMEQYRNYIVGSLLKSKTKRNYEIIPVVNTGNRYSAAQALNIGIERARGGLVVLCHQDVLFYEDWVDKLFERVAEIETTCKDWGVLGTAGISEREDVMGLVHNINGSVQWSSTVRATVYPVQTVDEHCMIIRKDSGLRFDETVFDGWHFYGPDICLTALSRGMKNYGVLCPLVHNSNAGSLMSGRREFMRLLNSLSKKWSAKFKHIRTPTSVIRGKKVRTFIKFKRG